MVISIKQMLWDAQTSIVWIYITGGVATCTYPCSTCTFGVESECGGGRRRGVDSEGCDDSWPTLSLIIQ